MAKGARAIVAVLAVALGAAPSAWADGCAAAAGAASVAAVGSAEGVALVTGREARRVRLGARADAIAWSQGLERFVVAVGRELWTVAPTGAAHRVARLPGRARSLALVPDRATLVAVATDSSQMGVAVYRLEAERAERVGGGVEPARAPRRVSAGDVDGDGVVEVLVLVTGRARFDPHDRLRPFVYGWDGRRLYPKWLGSRLARPFDDAALADLDGDGRADLVAVEQTRDGRRELAAYRWTGFGFERIAAGAGGGTICGLGVDAAGRILAVVDSIARAHRIDAGRIEIVAERAGPADAVVDVDGRPAALAGHTLFHLPGATATPGPGETVP